MRSRRSRQSVRTRLPCPRIGSIGRFADAKTALTGRYKVANATTLVLSGSQVLAKSDYELFDDESMPVVNFLDILRRWRAEVVAVRDSERPQIPETYRRKPYPN